MSLRRAGVPEWRIARDLGLTVTAVQTYAKNHFPSASVYGAVPDAELRLITCGGTFDYAKGSYLSNVVVYARLSS